jgi:hypothetical protein
MELMIYFYTEMTQQAVHSEDYGSEIDQIARNQMENLFLIVYLLVNEVMLIIY